MIAFRIGAMNYGATMSTEEVARELGCSTDVLYDSVRSGAPFVEPLRLGTRLRWPTARVLAALGIEQGREGASGQASTAAAPTMGEGSR